MMACMQRRYARLGKESTGVTLVETMVTIAILAILLSVALPSLTDVIINSRLEGKAREYVNHMNWARSLAVSNNETFNLRISSDEAASCYMVFRGPLNECNCNSSGATCSTPANALLTMVLPYREGVRVSPRTNSSSTQISPAQGTISPTLTAVFTGDNGKVIHNVSNILGRTRSCTPETESFGMPICP